MNANLKEQLNKLTDAELYSGLLTACTKQVNLNKRAANQFNIYSGEQIAGEAYLLIDKILNRDASTIDEVLTWAARDALRDAISAEKETDSENFEFYSIDQSQSADDGNGNNIVDLYLADSISRPTEKTAVMNTLIDSVVDDKTDRIILNCIKRGEPISEAEKLAKKTNTAIMQRKTKLIKRLNKVYTEK